jgi:hypothetical protein
MHLRLHCGEDQIWQTIGRNDSVAAAVKLHAQHPLIVFASIQSILPSRIDNVKLLHTCAIDSHGLRETKNNIAHYKNKETRLSRIYTQIMWCV